MKNLRIFLFFLLVFTGVFSANAAGKLFFVAPNGLPTNNGSQASPWDLTTALKHRPTIVGPGDTICLRGGVYRGTFTSYLTGAPGSPIVVKSCPGEWAIIDGNQKLNLVNAIGAGKEVATFSGDVNMPDVAVVMIDGERMQLFNRVGNSYSINVRGWDATAPAPHNAGSTARVVGEILTIFGADVVFTNFEVTDTKIERVLQKTGSNPVDFNHRFPGINVFAPRSKVINTVVHDTGQGIGFWSQAVDAEVYGNILYNNGEEAPDRGHGHGIYTQNYTGLKTIDDNIIFGNYGNNGMTIYGSSTAQLTGYSVNGNIHFLNLWLLGGNAPADNITVNNNFLYSEGLRLGWGNPSNGSINITNNYAYGPTPIDIKWWKKIVMTGNRFYQNGSIQGVNLSLLQPPGIYSLPNYQIDNNKYSFGRVWQVNPFFIGDQNSKTSYYSFSQWNGMGYDKNGIWSGATSANQTIVKPTGVDVFYRPNKYEKGRAHIVIYNYNKAPAVQLDLAKTGLVPGQRFEIRNGQNFKAPPVLAGTYSSQFVSVNPAALNIAQPTGNTTVRNPEISSEFSVLVVVPLP